MKGARVAPVGRLGIAGRRTLGLIGIAALVFVLGGSLPASAIAHGTVDTVHTYAVATIAVFPDGSIFWCSGTLVSARVVVTAAHCTPPPGVTLPIFVSFATNLLDRKSWREVVAFATHPEFTGTPTVESDPHDVAVLILAKPVKDITPAKLATVGYLDALRAAGLIQDAKFAILGYGLDENLQLTGDRRIAYSEYQNLHEARLITSSNANRGNGGVCNRDSGGPVLHSDGITEFFVALHRGGSGNCAQAGYNEHYRVDTVSSQNFILGEIAANQ